MSKVVKVLVCDDLRGDDREFENAIGDAGGDLGIETERLWGSGLKEELNKLISSADEILTGDGQPDRLQESEFDKGFDLVVLDNNLAHLEIEGARLTAEAIAGYIRAFSSAPYIVSVNKNPDVDFDLRYLIGDYTTRTDLAVNTRHLSNAALWTGKGTDVGDGFRPWYWPRLLDAGKRRREQIEFVREWLDESVSDAFGISKREFDYLSRQARSLLSQAEETGRENRGSDESSGFGATFRDVFRASGRSIPGGKERKALIEKAGKGRAETADIVARAVAADIDLWFRRDLLGPQEVLVDIPHLLMRMPFLLGGGASEPKRWNDAVDARDEPFGLDSALFRSRLTSAWLGENVWAPVPCFWWPKLRDDNELNAYFRDSDPSWADVVFCEDRSAFLPFESDDDAQPREFVAQFEGSWNRRYVTDIPGVRYTPKTRFAQ